MCIPNQPPSFHLKRLAITSSYLLEVPLQWILSGGSSQSLKILEIGYPQAEWTLFPILSRMRTEGHFRNVEHLSFSLADSRGGALKYFNQNVSTPLSLWSGIKTIYIFGRDSKANAALIHGISN